MLQRSSPKVAECHRHAAEARQRAESTTNKTAKADFLDIEKRWLNLARSYEFADRLNLNNRENERRRGGRTR